MYGVTSIVDFCHFAASEESWLSPSGSQQIVSQSTGKVAMLLMISLYKLYITDMIEENELHCNNGIYNNIVCFTA